MEYPYIPDSPGVSRPSWMSDEEWAEYQATSAEYAYEVSRPAEPDETHYSDDFADYDRAEYEAQAAEDTEHELEEIMEDEGVDRDEAVEIYDARWQARYGEE